MLENLCTFAQIFNIMGFFSDIIESINQSKQNDLLFKAKHSYLSFDEKVEIARKLDREHMRELYHVWFRDSDGLRAIVASGHYYIEFQKSIMLRTDVPVDVSKKIIYNFVYNDQEEIVLTRFFSETNQELFEVLKRCLYLQHIQFPRDKDKEVVKCCLDKYVDQFIKEHSEYVNDICYAIETKCSYFSVSMNKLQSFSGINCQTSISTGYISDKRKEMFRQRFGKYIKEYAFKEISYHELRKKIERLF